MERKGGNTAVVTTQSVSSGLARISTTQAEEKALRMRYGAKVDVKAPLPKAHGDNEGLGDELLVLELRLLSALKRQQAMNKPSAPAAKAPRNAAKAKVVASLKARKK